MRKSTFELTNSVDQIIAKVQKMNVYHKDNKKSILNALEATDYCSLIFE